MFPCGSLGWKNNKANEEILGMENRMQVLKGNMQDFLFNYWNFQACKKKELLFDVIISYLLFQQTIIYTIFEKYFLATF